MSHLQTNKKKLFRGHVEGYNISPGMVKIYSGQKNTQCFT